MKEFDFDKLKNIEIPDSWVKGALNVPVKSSFTVIFLKKVLPVAASMMLVLVLSFFVFYMVKDNNIKTIPDDTTNNTVSTQTNEINKNNTFETDTTLSNTESTEDKNKKPTSVKEQTPDNTEPEKETQKPTEETQTPTQAPVIKPTTPSDNPSDTPTEDQGSQPDDIPGKPSGTPVTPQSMVSLRGSFDESLLNGSDEIYVSIKRLSYGDQEVEGEASIQKYLVTDIKKINNIVYVKYYVSLETQVTSTGDYYYCFYNNKGEILYTDIKYIEV